MLVVFCKKRLNLLIRAKNTQRHATFIQFFVLIPGFATIGFRDRNEKQGFDPLTSNRTRAFEKTVFDFAVESSVHNESPLILNNYFRAV